jgi:hypothetical protein
MKFFDSGKSSGWENLPSCAGRDWLEAHPPFQKLGCVALTGICPVLQELEDVADESEKQT